MSWQAAAFGILAVGLAAGFYWYERDRPDARIIALVGTLAAFAALGRIAFAAVPNVKPTTDIVLIAGFALGAGPGFAVGAIAGLTSNFFFGQGPWTPWQMAAWGATGLIGAGLAGVLSIRGRRPSIGRWRLALVCCATGFAFTAFQDVGDWVTFSDHSWAQLGVYVGQGLGFDAIHAAGCLAFALAFGPALTRSIQRFSHRLAIEWLPPGGLMAAAVVALGATMAVSAPRAHATSAHAPSAHAASAPVGPSVSYLLQSENSDGGFGAARGQPSNQLYAGWAALGLAASGIDLAGVSHDGSGLLDYVRRSSAGDVGSLERTILVAAAAGLSPRSFAGHDLVSKLRHALRPDGSVQGQVNLTAFAVLALRGASAPAGARTLTWLERQQDRDGGFSFAGVGGSSDVDDTGATLEALAGQGGRAVAVRAAAVTYLRRQQDHDGGFPSQPGSGSNAQSTAWAIQGLVAAEVDPAGLHRHGAPSPVGYLRSLIGQDGRIAYARGNDQSPVWVTGEALMALEGKPLPLAPPPAAPASAAPAGPAPSTTTRTAPAAPAPATLTAPSTSQNASRPRPTTSHSHSRPSGPRPSVRQRSRRPPRTSVRAAISTTGLAGTYGVLTALILAPVGLG